MSLAADCTMATFKIRTIVNSICLAITRIMQLAYQSSQKAENSNMCRKSLTLLLNFRRL